MELREGATYRARCGLVVGPMHHEKTLGRPWWGRVHNEPWSPTFNDDGTYLSSEQSSKMDLINEVEPK